MALRDALRAFFSPAPGMEPSSYPIGEVVFEGRGLTADDMWGPYADDWRSGQGSAGERVDRESALQTIAMQAAVRLLVNDVGSLPTDAFRRVGENDRKELRLPPWVTEPNPLNPNDTWEDHVKQTVYGMLTDGNAFTRCFPSVFQTTGVEALDPSTVDIQPFRGSVVFDVKGVGALTPAEIVHVPWMKVPGKARGLNPIEYAKQGLGIALASDRFVGSYFENGATFGGVLKYPQGVTLTDDQIKDVLNRLNKAHRGAKKAHALGALTDGGEIVFPDYKNRDAQLLELRDQIVEDVARLYGIPPHMLGSQKPGAVGYASVEQRSIDYVTHAILPIVRRIEVGYSRLLRGQQTYIRFNVNGLLRGDLQARAAFYSTMLESKVIRRDEVRALEDLPFDTEGVGYLETPNNNAPEPPAEPQEPAA